MLKSIRKTVSNDLKMHNHQKHAAAESIYCSLEGAAAKCILSDSQSLDIAELTKRMTIEQQNKEKFKILRNSKIKMDLMLLLTLIFLFSVVYGLISSIEQFDWHSFDESLSISPYPTLYNYVCHYFIDAMVLFVLIVWLYSPSKCCTHIQMNSLIAHLCCVCCLVEEIENEGINRQIYFVDHDHEFRVKDYRKMCD